MEELKEMIREEIEGMMFGEVEREWLDARVEDVLKFIIRNAVQEVLR